MYERDELLARVKAPPPATLEDALRTLDAQAEIIGLIKKHRALQGEGQWQWPVTSIRLHDEANVAVTAHADDPTRIGGEWVSLVISMSGISLATVPAVGLENQLVAPIPVGSLPEEMQDALMGDGSMPVGGFVLRLGGLGIPPYDRLNDPELDDLLSALRGAAAAISGAVVGPGPPLALEGELEEDQ
jgi:hypothetical protein